MSKLTHFDSNGQAHMVDISEKPITRRIAIAEGKIIMQAITLDLIRSGGHKKGDVLGIARIAGIMASKKTADLIPLCHPLAITKVKLEFKLQNQPPSVYCQATVATSGQTGVEMEALTAVQIALLTIYDMCKSVDKGMTMQNIGLVEKQGGKSGHWQKSVAN